MDVWSGRMVGWSTGDRVVAGLADGALGTAVARRRPPEGRARHGDHGPHHASPLVGKTMREAGIRPSMGSVAGPWDNAVTESLMGIIKSERVRARAFAGREEAAPEAFEHIECFHDRVGARSALGWVSPEQFEREHGHDRLRAE